MKKAIASNSDIRTAISSKPKAIVESDSDSTDDDFEEVQSDGDDNNNSNNGPSSGSVGPSNTIDSNVLCHSLTMMLIGAFTAHNEMNPDTDEQTKKLCVIKFAEFTLGKLGVDSKRFFSGALAEVVTAAQTGLVLNPILQGPDATDKEGKLVELKNSQAKLGEKANFNFTLPDEDPKLNTTERKEYYKAFEASMKKKGENIIMTHSYSVGKSTNTYRLSMDFFCFYVESKDSRNFGSRSPHDRKKCTKVNIGAVSCKKCTRVHRLDALMEMEKEWIEQREENKNSPKWREKALVTWKPRFHVEVKQSC